jgi:serine/threonine protein kinase/Flp pilus assembly protein TadD
MSHYTIQEKLGEGGMGEVYLAEDTKLKRQVALKFLPQEIDAQAEERERFKLEARAAAALNHPNITTVHAIEEIEGKTCIVMEYIDGQELREKIKTGAMKLEEAFKIAVQIAEGLQAAHEKGIVHRDIKSSNIMLTARGHVKIMDFGLAKLAGVSKITKSGTTVGTTSYMSPEQIQAMEVDHRTDLWSFGVLLYEMLTGQLPFRGAYDAAIIYEILNEEPEAIKRFRADVPDHIVTLVSQLLQKDPGKRLSSAQHVIERLGPRSPEESKREGERSIAVLYFENMSPEKENEYFCAGMTEDLIFDLSKIQKLRVIPRSDVLPFRDKEVSSRRVGEMLGVNYILEGSVRKGASKIRITAQLIEVKSGFQVWADRYDRLLEDIFDIQIEVSEKIAEALKVSLTDSEKRSLAKKPTVDLRAYDLYKRGSEFLIKRGKKNFDAAIQMFEHALTIDPTFSLAYMSIAEAHYFCYVYDGDRSHLDKMIQMKEKLLHLDPESIEAHCITAMVSFYQKHFEEAKRLFEGVIGLRDDFYLAYYWLGLTTVILGDYQSGITYFKKAAAMKPYSEEPVNFLRETYLRAGDRKAADQAAAETIERVQRKLEVDPEDFIALSRMAAAYASLGDEAKAVDTIRKVMEIDPDDAIAFYNCAGAYAVLGKKKEALAVMEKVLGYGFFHLMEWIAGDPHLESIRDDPQYQELIAKVRT